MVVPPELAPSAPSWHTSTITSYSAADALLDGKGFQKLECSLHSKLDPGTLSICPTGLLCMAVWMAGCRSELCQ